MTPISPKTLMAATEVAIMIAMKMLLFQIVPDQPKLMKHLELGRHPILPQTTMDTWIQN